MKKTIGIIVAVLALAACKEELPPLDTSCTTDADCSVTTRDITGDSCCTTCDSLAVSSTWLEKTDAICSAQTRGKDYFDRCPQISCTEPNGTVAPVAECVSGSCMAKTTATK